MTLAGASVFTRTPVKAAFAKRSVAMGMMHVRDMDMPVPHGLVAMGMGMRLPRRIARQMGMLMMFIVHMRMGVLHGVMPMQVLMIFRQMKPDAQRH